MINRQTIIGMLLFLLFSTFTIGGVLLIDFTFTIAPFTIYGQPIPITISVGEILLLAGLLMLAFMLKLKR